MVGRVAAAQDRLLDGLIWILKLFIDAWARARAALGPLLGGAPRESARVQRGARPPAPTTAGVVFAEPEPLEEVSVQRAANVAAWCGRAGGGSAAQRARRAAARPPAVHPRRPAPLRLARAPPAAHGAAALPPAREPDSAARRGRRVTAAPCDRRPLPAPAPPPRPSPPRRCAAHGLEYVYLYDPSGAVGGRCGMGDSIHRASSCAAS
jgi:hypothetical protein